MTAPTSLVIDLAATGQQVYFPISGDSEATLQLVLKSGIIGSASLDVTRGNSMAAMLPLEVPVALNSGATMTPVLDVCSGFLGVRVATPGGPGIGTIILAVRP